MLNVSDFTKKSVVAMIASLLAEERERCAKIVENYAESFTLYSYEARALGYVARKIREP